MVEVRDLTVHLADFSLGPLSFEVGRGEFFVILGPSGAGKTVLLETIAGIYRPTGGEIVVDGRDITRLPPEMRGVGMVYQDYALFPHISVRSNIEYGLKIKGSSREERRRRVTQLAQLLGIEHLLGRLPPTLSGGEGQRVALARALAPGPKVLLLDEPLSALDPTMREKLSWELKRTNRATGVPFLMVTHDIREALQLGDRVALLRDGKIEQMGPPEELLRSPASPLVAEFLGMKNLFRARFRGAVAEVDGMKIVLTKPTKGKEGFVAIRPDEIILSKEPFPSSARNQWKGRVLSLVDVGTHIEVYTAVRNTRVLTFITRSALEDLALKEGDEIYLSFKAVGVEVIEEVEG